MIDMYDLKVGRIIGTTTNSFTPGTSTTITFSGSNVLPAAPNYATLSDGDYILTLKYTTLSGNAISGLSIVEYSSGGNTHVFGVNSNISRPLCKADMDAIKTNIDELYHRVKPPVLTYTIAVDRTVSSGSTRITYMDDAASFTVTDAETLYKAHNRPCVVSRTTGKVAYYLKWDDFAQKEDGTASVLDGTDGDVCIEMDRVWWKAWTDGNKDMFSWTYEDPENLMYGYTPWAHFKGPNATVPHIYVGVFKFAQNSAHLGSYVDLTNKPARSQNLDSFETNCKKELGDSNNAEYTIARMATYTLIRKMHDFVAKDTDSQGYFGKGITGVPSASESTLKPTSEGYDATHMMKSGTTADSVHGVNSIGFNNFWGNVWEFCGQVVYSNRRFKCNYLNDTDSYIPNLTTKTYATITAPWYETKFDALPHPASDGYVYPKGDLNDGPCAAMGGLSGGSTTSYYYDGTYMSATNKTYRCVLFGGYLAYGAGAGVRCCALHIALSSSDWSIGARLLIVPEL